jgi:cell division septation protein DedD
MEDNQQLELFSQGEDNAKSASLRRSNPFVSSIRKSERLIITAIVFAITGIISFSLGVEKGKRIALTEKPGAAHSFDLAATRPKAISPQPVAVPVAGQPPVEVSAATQQGYTIQLASYKNLSSAQLEAQTLKKRGLSPLILTKSGYKVLCVGKFNNKETAQQLLSELSKRYEGCRIRRL